ncbi:MAG: SDR family oxidoreductase [Acidimicrobiales bacterium]|nr:SDR family oxidoreductase [Acidimicrobiales bacterium]
MDLQLAGTNVLVTGAGQGLGLAIGQAFVAEGANVSFLYNSSKDGAEAAASAARTAGLKAIAVGADLRDPASVEAAVAATAEAIGPIQVLVNNAAATQSKPFFETTEEDWAPQIDVTVGGTIRISHIVSKQMADNGGGNIINLMGDSGRVGESRLLVTAATRSSTIGLTKSLAKEMARHNIRANAVAIALVQTENLDEHTGAADDERMKKMLSMYPLRRLGRPDDVTPMILLLASPLSSWTTGQVIAVNGGYSMV